MWEVYLMDVSFFQAGTLICNFKLSGNTFLVGRHHVVYCISQHETATKRHVIFLQVVTRNCNMVFFDWIMISLNLWTIMVALEHGIWNIWNLLSSSKLSLQTFLWTGSLFSCYVVSWMSMNNFFSSRRHLMYILYMRSSWKKKIWAV